MHQMRGRYIRPFLFRLSFAGLPAPQSGFWLKQSDSAPQILQPMQLSRLLASFGSDFPSLPAMDGLGLGATFSALRGLGARA